MNLLQLVYISEATQTFTRQQATELVARSHVNSRAKGISGALYLGDNHVIQALEGADEALIKLDATILADPRHGGIHLVVVRPLAERLFPAWGMGLVSNLKREIDVSRLLKLDRSRVGGWNHASWDEILYSFREQVRGLDSQRSLGS